LSVRKLQHIYLKLDPKYIRLTSSQIIWSIYYWLTELSVSQNTCSLGFEVKILLYTFCSVKSMIVQGFATCFISAVSGNQHIITH
jgi:hypothetical protein